MTAVSVYGWWGGGRLGGGGGGGGWRVREGKDERIWTIEGLPSCHSRIQVEYNEKACLFNKNKKNQAISLFCLFPP